MKSRSRGWSLLAIGFVICLGGFSKPSNAATFAIPQGEATQTLVEWSVVSGIQVLFDFNELSEVTTREVRGKLDSLEALIVMLDGTGYHFEPVNDRTLAVIRGRVPPCKPEMGPRAPLPPCRRPGQPIRGTVV